MKLAVSLLAATKAMAGNFSFTKIADTNDFLRFANIAPAINDSGTVVFIASPTLTEQGLYVSDGGSITEIVKNNLLLNPINDPSTSISFGSIDINNKGTVAFNTIETFQSTRRNSLYVSQDGSLKALQLGVGGLGAGIGAVALNNQDDLVYVRLNQGYITLGARVILKRLDQPDVTLASAFSPITSSPVTPPPNVPLARIDAVAINNPGEVAFAATDRDSQKTLVFTYFQNELTTLIEPETNVSALDINDSGDVLLSSQDAIRLLNRSSGEVRTVADTNSGLRAFASPALNNNGDIAFIATLANGEKGIFTGADPTKDKVIATGDSLLGVFMLTEMVCCK